MKRAASAAPAALVGANTLRAIVATPPLKALALAVDALAAR